jgi:hypothetical protein
MKRKINLKKDKRKRNRINGLKYKKPVQRGGFAQQGQVDAANEKEDHAYLDSIFILEDGKELVGERWEDM